MPNTKKPDIKKENESLVKKPSSILPRGEIFIIKERCKGCRFCIEFCPRHVLKESYELNLRGYYPPIFIENPPNETCIACDLCTMVCPEFAIYSKRKKDIQQEKKNEK